VNISQRPIAISEGYTINYDGVVFFEKRVVPTTSMASRKDIQMLCVEMSDGVKNFVWNLLSQTWEGNRLLLPRDGNFLRWTEDNRIVLRELSSPAIQDPDDIQAIWYWYKRGTWCHEMSEKTQLRYEANQYWRLICDILCASVR